MNENKCENLSSLMDNEQRSDEQLIDVLNELSSSETDAETWANYHLISDTLRDNLNQSISIDISGSIANAIANEPTVFSPKNTQASSNANAESTLNEHSQIDNKPTNLIVFKAKVVEFLKPLGQMAIAASAAGLMIVSVQNTNDSTPDFESIIPSSVAQTMPFAGSADPVSFNYPNESKNKATVKNHVNNEAKNLTLDQQARIEQKRRFQALLIDHQQQIKWSQYSSAVSEK